MAEYFPLDQLSAVYLIDLCEPLLEVARKRFAAKGFKNVQVLCQDARDFTLPGLAEGQKVDLFTCSYSLSMVSAEIPTATFSLCLASDFPCFPSLRPNLLLRFLPSTLLSIVSTTLWTKKLVSLV